jgi:glycerol-3-phosphate acyltransferase PlsY
MSAEGEASKGASRRGLFAAGVLGYLVGSFPTADLVSKYVTRRSGDAGVDLRAAGSGNPGAVNAATVLGRKWGLLVFAGDMIKGIAACLLGRATGGDNGAYLAGTTAVAGHCYPAWSRFRGGKGVATSFATTLVCFPAYAPFDLAVFATTFFLSKGRASLATAAPDTKPPARTGALVASGLFSAAATYWWLRRKGNLWGPTPTVGLPLYALATSGIIAYRLLTWTAVRRPEPSEQLSEKEPALVA